MKTKSLLAICVINTLVASVHALRPSVAFAAVRPVVTELEFPTYGFSDPDPVPRTESPLYPYFRFDGSTEKSAPRRWKAVILENDKIKVTMLPEIGGKVWGAEDKASGKAFLYYNHVVKFRNIALRGPWCSGGIEFNFGITGHAPTSATPVDWCVRTNADGSASYFAGATEYINRTTWQVEVRLAPGDDHFTMRTVWFNGSGVEMPLYHWMNAAFPLPSDTEFVFPGRDYVGHPGDAHRWPMDGEGHDLSIYAQNAFGANKSYHVVNGDNRLFGVWWPGAGLGAVHRNAQDGKFGRKIWLWSPARSGAIWEDLLTDSDGQYAELQSGRAFQQPRLPCDRTPFKIPPFTPGSTESFDETWGVVRSRDGFGRPEMDMRPRPVEMPKDFDWNSAQGLCIRGVQMVRDRNDVCGGERLLKAALDADRFFVPALDALASLAYRRARYAEAVRFAERALAVDTYDGTANLIAGLAAFAQGDFPTAKERLGVATFAPELRAAAYAQLARIALREKDWQEALRLSDAALAANAKSLEALWSRAVALRKAGRTDAARSFAAATLDELPLFHAMRYEEGKAGGKDDFRASVRGEFPHETFMDIAGWYLEAGLGEEAGELLGFAGESPMARLMLAYCGYAGRVPLPGGGRGATALPGDGQKDCTSTAGARVPRARELLDLVAAMPVKFAFPFRREMLPALEWAAKENANWKFKYYLALFRAANGDDDGAAALLEACGGGHAGRVPLPGGGRGATALPGDARGEPDDAVFYLYRAGRRLGTRRLADALEAERLGGGWRAGLMRFKCEAEAGETDNALATARRLVKDYPDVNHVKLAYAKALLAAKRHAECVKYLESSVILPSEYGENANGIWREACYALGENAKAETWPENLGAGKPFPQDTRPYEFRNAGRDKDDVPPLVDFEDGKAWHVVTADAAAMCEITQEEQLFGTNTLRLSYCGKGKAPRVSFAPSEPVRLPAAFDTFYVWVKGNHFGHGGNSDFSIPNPELSAVFRRAQGDEVKISLAKVAWPDWHQVNRRFTEEERVKLVGAAFAGFELSGGTQAQYLQMHFDDVSVFTDDLRTPLDVKPRARRNLKPLAGAVQGINTGEGTLPFPTREETIIPKTSAPKKGDLVAQFNGGAVKKNESANLKTSVWRQGKSLVVDFYAPAGTVTEVSAGTACEAKVVKNFTVPYLAYGDGKGRLKIDLLEGGWYRSAVFDWYRSNASLPGCTNGAFTMCYRPKTDGTYNPVSERLVVTLSRDFAEVLPEIPNPVSPYKAVTGRNAWRAHGSFEHAYDRAFWREVKRAGIEHVVVNDHETMWRDRGESFTYRHDAAPGRGGDAGAEAYSRFMRGELGYVYGPYNNYTDFSPMNAHWSRDLVSRNGDGTMQTAWVRCYAPKPVFAPQLCEEIAPKAQAKFAFNTAYCDVHTAVTPYSRTDYDARSPGAATFAQTFYAWGELMLLQKRFWDGPVYSEGGRQFMYSGLADGNYAQDGGYNFHTQPWIVDFDVLKIHPLECNFGMGTLAMFSPGKTFEEIRRHRPHVPTEKERDGLVDLFLTATVAFGHAPFLVLDYCFEPSKAFGPAYHGPTKTDLDKGLPVALKSYAMVQPIAARYTQSVARKIRYFGAGGRMLTSSEAIASGDVARNHVFVEYADGTCVVANGNAKEWLKAKVNGRVCNLPPRAFKAWTKDGKVRVEISEDAAGKRTYFSDCPEFTYKDGRLKKKTKLFGGLKAPHDPPPADRAKALAEMAAIPPAKAEVRTEGGVTALYVDGKKTVFNAYKGAADYRLMGEAGADMVLSFNGGSRLYASVDWDKAAWDPKKGAFDFTRIEDDLLRIHEANPRARVILAVEISPDRAFQEAHPDEIFVNDKGERGLVHLHGFRGYGEKPLSENPIDFYAYSYTGEAWRAHVEKGLCALAEWLRKSPAGNIVVGFAFCGGMDGQFVQWEYGPEHGHFDYSEANRRALCRYLKELYGTDAALQAAWGDSSVTLATARNPSPAEFASRPFFDDKPGFGRRLADCRRFISVGTARALNGFAKTVKKAWGRQSVVETWWTTAIWAQPSRLALDELVKDDAINIVATVSYYGANRAVGGPGASANNTIASLNRRNILYIQEFDHRTRRTQHVSAAAPKAHAIPSTAEEFDIQITRDAASVIAAGGQGFYLFDMFGSWYHEPEAMATIRKAFAMNSHASRYAGRYEKPSVAIVMDEKTRLLAERTAYATPNAIWRTSGVTPALRLLSDVDAAFPAYRLCVLWNAVSITKAQAGVLRRLAEEEGTMLVVAGETGIASRDFASQREALAALGPNIVRIADVAEITDEKLNVLARQAGARVYAEPGNATYVGNGVACVHRLKGPATVDFGRAVTPIDPITGRTSSPIRLWRPDIPTRGVASMCYLPGR